ncbi:protein of unknown function [Parapedobacter composti]|uniref:DUF4905 domain-containing protein n=1 Tax=Parapedobacter composti TaxID=623281 RepID=A0A1I1LBY9_9SPHI|nr:DUF4905 domain-containing protein [Parapedobacter composti]SFC70604.1 protein of unknown function [Parapedobacter composti]
MDKYTLKNVFQKSFLGVVWRMEADTSRGWLAIETRRQDTGVPAFSVIRYATGESIIHEIHYRDRHWTLAGAVNGMLILKAFGHDSPAAPGIACIDAVNGQVRWEQFNYQLLALDDGDLIVRHRNFASGGEQRIDALHGQPTQKKIIPNKPTGHPIVLPERYKNGTPLLLTEYKIFGDLYHCVVGQANVWAFHEQTGQQYRIRLVVSNDLTILADKVILEGLPKMLPELFFMIANQLFIIGNNKREIISYLV